MNKRIKICKANAAATNAEREKKQMNTIPGKIKRKMKTFICVTHTHENE